MSTKVFKYILDFSGNTQKFNQEVGGMKGLLKGAAAAAGALFAADMVLDGARAVAEYAQEISAVRDSVAELTGIQGAALDTMTGQVKAIADAYDADVDQAIKASNLVMRQFGESGEDAFNVINAGMATAANANEDFLEQVSEYAPHFKEAGLAASEMVAIMAKGNELGVFNDKTADAIKEGTIRLREMTNTTREALEGIGLSSDKIQQDISSGSKSMFQVMQLVSRQLKNLPKQAPAVGAALADIFGGVGEDAIQFIRNLDEIDTSMEGILENATESAKAQMDWAGELKEFHTVASQVFGDTNTLLLKMKTSSLALANDGIKWLVGWANYFIDLYNESEYFRYQIDAISFAFKTLWQVGSLTLKTIADLFSLTVEGVQALFTGDWSGAKSAFDDLKGNFTEAGQTLAENYRESFKKELNEREKIKLIGLSDEDARIAGEDAGKNMAAGMRSGMAAMSGVMSANTTVAASKKNKKESGLDTSKLESMEPMLQRNIELIESLRTGWSSFGDDFNYIIESMMAGGQKITDAHMMAGNMIDGLMGIAQQGISTFSEWGNAVRDAALTAVNSFIAEGVAGAISTALAESGIPFPLNMVAGAVAAAGATALLSSAIPSFTTGGIMPGISFHGDSLLARINSGEEVLRRDDPRHTFNQQASTRQQRPVVAAPAVNFGYDRISIGVKMYEEELQKRG